MNKTRCFNGALCAVSCGLMMTASLSATADSVWTGAADACWTNAANWANGEVPGRYYAPDGTLTGTKEMTATFGACSGAVEIDLDGLFSIGKILVTGANAPRYTFGTSTTQVLPIEAIVNGSRNQFTVDSSVTRAPIVRAIFGFGNGIESAEGNTLVYLYNNSVDTVVINDFGYMRRAAANHRTRAVFAGTGPIAVNGEWKKAPANAVQDNQSYICSGSSVGPTFNKSFSFGGLFNSSAVNSKMTIADGVTITTTGAWGDFGNLPFTIDGPGTIAATPGKFAQCYNNSTINFNCRLALTSVPAADYGLQFYGQGGYHINNSANTLSGTLQYWGSNASSAFVFDKIGRIGETCPLSSVTTIRANNYLKVVFTGSAPDVTDRVFEIGSKDVANNWNNTNHSFVVEQAGTASLTVESSPSLRSAPADGIHKFTLTGNGAGEGIWAGVLADGSSTKLQVTKAGTGRWTYTAANTYTGDTIVNAGTLALGANGTLAASPVKLAGGTLEVSGTKTLASIDAAGASTLSLAAGAALTVGAITQSSGSLAVTTGDGSSLVCLALANTAPGWITVNGYAAEFDSAGRLKRQSYAVTAAIAARGDTVPNDASAVVGITSPGTGGADELAAAATTVAALVQKTSVPAVISLAGGRTLSAGALAVDESGSALTIGADVGEGTLAAASSTLTFDAANAASDASITVNSALNAAKIEKKGDGDLFFRAPFAFAGEMEVTAGRVVLTNETTLSLAATLVGGQPGTSKVQVDGPGSITFPHKNPDYHGDFVLSGGTVQLDKDDLTVTHFGANDGDLVVANGASLVLDGTKGQGDNLKMNGKRIRFSGHGPNGSGALVANEFFFNFLDDVTLDGDTTFACTRGKVNSGYVAFNAAQARCLDMGGHALNFLSGDGRGGYFVFKFNTSVTNAGPLVIGGNCTLSAYDGAWLGEGSAAPIVMCPGAGFSPYRLTAQDRKWEIRGTNGAPSRITVQNTVGVTATNSYRFNGSVTFAPQELGTMACWRMLQHGNCKFGPLFFAGPICGDGSFLIDANYRGDFHIEGAGNTFTGTIGLTNNWLYSAVCLHWPSSIPDYSKLVLSGGRAVAYAGNWSDAQIVSLANTASLTNGAIVTVNTTGCAGNEHEMTLSDEAVTSGTFGIGHEGPGRLAVAGGWTKPVRLASYGGELALTGDGERKVEAVTLGHPYMSGTNAALSIEGGSVTLGNGPVAVGFGQLVTNDGYLATLKISNASIVAPEDNSACAYPQISVGYGCEPGFMEIGDGAEVRATMTVGHTHVGNNTAAGMGAVAQKAGSRVVLRAHSSVQNNRMYIGNGDGTWGAYALEGGTFDAGQMTHTVLAYGTRSAGTFTQAAGSTANFGMVCIGWGAFSSAHYYMTGGTATLNALQIPYVNWGGQGGLSTLTIEGGEMTVKAGNTVAMAQANPENSTTDYGTTAIVNLLSGGTLHATVLSKKNNYHIMPEVVHAYVNFDGGILSANGSNDLFGQEGYTMDAVTAFARGAEIAVEGSYTSRVRVPISAPTGNGVASVAWAGTSAAEFKYLGMPTVDIVGDGHSASAVALFDRASGSVTGIKVVSPGCGYTEAKAVIRSEALCSAKSVKAMWHTNVCVLTSSTPASGGLKKSGTGTLELYATNTYGGATTIAGGTLKLMCDDAIPAGSQLVLAGGTLDLNGKTASFGSIGGRTGTVTGGNVSLSSSWTVDVAELAQGRYPVLTGNASFAAGATVSFVNTQLLDKNHSGGYPFLAVSGTVENPPVADASLPTPWFIARAGNVFKVVYPHGTVLMFR